MGIFESYAELAGIAGDSTSFVDEAALAEEMEALEEMESAQNLSDDPEEACIEAMLIGKDNYYNVLMSIATEEMSYFKENGEEIVYEGAKLEAFFSKVKALIDKAWSKIKAIFEKALNAINSWISTDKRFVKKYKDKIMSAPAETFEITDGYKINLDKAADIKQFNTVVNVVGDFVRKTYYGVNPTYNENKEKVKVTDETYKQIYGGETKEDWKETFEKEIGLVDKQTFSLNSSLVIEELENGKKTQRMVKTAYKVAKATIAGMKKAVENAQKGAKKLQLEASGSYGKIISICNAGLSKINTMQSLQIKALKIYHSQCRKCAAKAVRGVKSSDDDSVDESAEFAYIV